MIASVQCGHVQVTLQVEIMRISRFTLLIACPGLVAVFCTRALFCDERS